MKTFLGILAALGLSAAMAAPALAQAPLPIDNKAHDRGKTEAPALVSQITALKCTVSDAYFIGENTTKDPKGATIKSKAYEVACQEGLGEVLVALPGTPVQFSDCITTFDTPGLRCRLPANGDPKATLGALITSAGGSCQVSSVRGIGTTTNGDTYLEAGCSDHPGFVLKRTNAGALTLTDCAQAVGTNLECKLTTKDQIDAANKGKIDVLVAGYGKPCQVSNSRQIGSGATNGKTYYEVACGAAGGFIGAVDKAGKFASATDCAGASDIGGGCKLTDATVSQAQGATRYGKLAQAAGFPCQVSKFRSVGATVDKSEVAEVACSDHPDGAVLLIAPNDASTKIYDCIRAGGLGQTCSLSDPSLDYPHYSAMVLAKGDKTCKVGNAKWLGRMSNKDDMIETVCSDGKSGWVIQVDPEAKPVKLWSCPQAKAAGLACSLPGNNNN